MCAGTKIMISLLCGLQAWTVNGETCKNLYELSQTMKGSGVVKIHSDAGRVGNTKIPPSDVTEKIQMFQSMDVDAFNIVQKTVTEVTTSNGQPVTVELDYILNWQDGLITVHTNMNNQSTCMTKALPRYLRLLPVGILVKKLAKAMSGLYTCVGHENGYDQLQTKIAFDFPRSPFAIDTQADAKIDDKGFLHEVKLHQYQKVSTKESQMSHTLDEDIAFTENRLGGPRKEDLVIPDEWKCPKPSIQESELDDLMAEWTGPKSPFRGAARLIPHMLVALKSPIGEDVIV